MGPHGPRFDVAPRRSQPNSTRHPAAAATLRRAVALLWAFGLVGAAAEAQTYLWDGGHPGQDSWTLAQNWNPNGAPVNNGTANLVFTGTIRLTPNANGAWNINSIAFDSFAGAFAIIGDTVTLQGSSVTYAIANNSSYSAGIANALTLASAQTWNANTAGLTFSGAISLGANNLTLIASSDIAMSGAVSGSGALLKQGTGTLTLSGFNSYAGGTTVSAGTLQGTTSGLQGNITNNSAVVFDQATSGTYAGVISGTGSLTKQNTGSVTLGAAQTFTGNTTVSGGTLALGTTNTLVTSTNVTLGSGATLALAGGNQTVASISGAGGINLGGNTLTTGSSNTSTEISGAISGGGGALVKNGTGTLTLTGTNSYTGGTTVNDGAVMGSSAGLQGNFNLVTANTAIVFDQTSTGTFSGVISGAGSLTKQNSGTVTLTGANTYLGTTTINGGTLSLGTAGALSSTNVVLINSGATLKLAAGPQTVGSFDGAGNIDLGSFALITGGTNTSTSLSGNIIGTGSLTKNGGGTLTLTGTNSYSGGTTLNGGTLRGTTSSIQNNITNNAAVVFDQTTTGTYSGAMSGTGSLNKQNTGTVILSGTNTYSGGTTVSGGALQGTSSSLQGSITNNAAVVFNQSIDGTYSGVMSGGGSLAKQNTGTLTLAGANTYSGGTTVSGGTLQGNATSLQGSIVNNATVAFNQSTDDTYSGVMSGIGSLTKLNTGTLTLAGANTYSGGTTVSGGTLTGTTTSLQGNIANNAAVVFDQASAGTFAGNMSGTGSLAKQNAGTLTLAGTNSYSGGTTVSGGTLQGTTTSLQGNIANNAAVVFDQSTSGTYAGVISGTGSVTKQNTGTVTLSGANTHSGDTILSGGTLALGANNALSAASALSLGATTTLNLGGFTTQAGTLTYHNAIIDFGTAATANSFLITGGGVSTGTLTINNFNSATDLFAFQTGASGVDSAFVSGIYFYGLGAGVMGATPQSISGYNGTWNLITPNTAAFETWDGGGNNNNWSIGNNWADNSAPAAGTGTGFTLRAAFDGSTRLTPTMNNSYEINTLRFNATAGNMTTSVGFTLNAGAGNTLTFGGTVPSIIQLSPLAQAVNIPLVLNTTTIVETSGAGNLTLAGVVSGTGGINKVGGSTLILSGANTYTGETTINAGTVILQNSTGLGSVTAGTTVTTGATLQLQGGITVGAEALALNGTLLNASGTNTYGGAISGSGSITVDSGSLSLSGSSSNTSTGMTTVNGGTLTLAKTGGATAVAGNLTIGAGTVALSGSEQIANTSAVSLTSASSVFNVGSNTETISSLSGPSAAGSVVIGSSGSLVTGDSSSTTFAGVISGAGALTKQGSGEFTLSGTNTYTGATTVSAGTLVLQNSAALGTTAAGTTVNSGATLQLENNITVGGEALTLNGALRNASGTNTYGGAISGTGAITVDGGALMLNGSGANTNTGTATVNGGTLTLAKTGGAAAVAGNLTIGAGTVTLGGSEQITNTAAVSLTSASSVFNVGSNTETIGSLSGTSSSGSVVIGTSGLLVTGDTTSTTFAGVISGAGAMTKQGSGTMTLTGANTYGGGTTVSAGTLVGSSTSLPGNIANSGAVIFDQSANGTYSGAMSGAGSLTKQNSGTLTLAGANTYSGGTTVSGGTLQGTTTSLQGAIANNAAVVFDQTTSGTYAGVMSGTGSLTKQNSGTVILTGANTYSGGTTVSGGTLQGNTTSLQGNIANNAAVAFDQASSGTYAGAMSGTGSLTKQNSGTLTLSGANTYSGGTTVSAGTLQGNTTSLQGNITNNAAVAFDQASSGTYAGVMSGTGSLTKNNSGALTLTGGNTYTGATTVNSGSLVLGSSNALSTSTGLTLASDTTLSLNGTSSQRINTLNFTNATIDFGTSGTANYLLLGSIGSATGTLTITNWTSGSDIFGFASNTVSQSILDNVYFSGVNAGLGATLSSTTTNIPGYGAFYTLTPVATFTWSGGQSTGQTSDLDNWSKSGNWTGGAAPSVAAVASIVFGGTVQTTNDMDKAYQIKGLLFRSDAGAFTINSSTGDALTIAGTGITNQSTYTQTVNVTIALSAAQTWTADSGNLLINGASVLNNANTLTIGGGYNTTINAAIGSGAGGIVKVGTGTLTLAGANTFTGGVTINAGVVAISTDGNLGAVSGGLTFGGGTLRTTGAVTSARAIGLGAAGGTLDSNGFDSTFSGVFSGAGALTKTGAGTVSLSAGNTYSGGTAVNGGTLAIAADSSLGDAAGGVTLAGGTLQTTAAVTSARGITLNAGGGTFDSNGFNSTLTGVISGSGGFTKAGTGTLALTGANTYSGGTTVSGGTLQGNTTSLHGNIVSQAGATVAFDQSTNGTYTGVISGAGSLTKLNSGSLTLSALNTYTGATSISGGTLVLGLSGALSSTTALTISSGATFNVNGVTQTIGSLAGPGNVTLGSGYLAVGANNTSTTFGGAIAGTGVFEKIGSGNLTFDASFNFGGELKLTGGTLTLAGINLTVGTLRISGNTTLDFGNSVASILTATNVIIENGAVLTINNWVDLQDFFYATGSLFGLNTTTSTITPGVMGVRGAAPLNQITFNGFSNTSTLWQTYDSQITPAPEPATYGMIFVGAAVAFVGLRRWRSRRRGGV